MKTLSLLLVKSDSYRLPNKNILPFLGKPMFVWNVEKCLKIFDKVYVSSDSDEILKIAKKAGAIPIKRPKNLCGTTPNIPVYRHALKHFKTDILVAVQANSPTINPAIISTIKKMMETGLWQEIITCHKDLSIYGSVWALTAKRIRKYKYKNFYKQTPEVLLLDKSIDIHTKSDFNKAILQARKR